MGAKNSKVEQNKKEKLLDKCYTYLQDNFHKFNTTQKISIAKDLVGKDIGRKLEHEAGANLLATLKAMHAAGS